MRLMKCWPMCTLLCVCVHTHTHTQETVVPASIMAEINMEIQLSHSPLPKQTYLGIRRFWFWMRNINHIICLQETNWPNREVAHQIKRRLVKWPGHLVHSKQSKSHMKGPLRMQSSSLGSALCIPSLCTQNLVTHSKPFGWTATVFVIQLSITR